MRARTFFDPTFVRVERRRSTVLAALLLWSVVSFLFISRFVLSAAEVEGDSMYPALCDGNRYLLNRWIYRFYDPQPGDIVAVQVPRYEDLSVKRIVASPGDKVQIKNGWVRVNGRRLEEPYLPAGVITTPGPLATASYRVDPGCYFVLGDNRSGSLDSRYFGAVRREWIIGRVAVSGHLKAGF